MAKKTMFLLSVSVFLISLGSSTSSYGQTACGCWVVETLSEVKCHSTLCDSSYPFQYCSVGCSFGHCGVTGYGLCCNTSWKAYSVYGANECGGNQNCGNGCGLVRRQASSHTRRRHRASVQSAHSGSAGLDRNHLAHEEVLFVPNLCRHTYGVLYPGDVDRQQTPPGSRRDGNFPSGGGL